jgi:hypothetical protein
LIRLIFFSLAFVASFIPQELTELRKGIPLAVLGVEDDIEKISVIVEDLLWLLERGIQGT